MTGSKSIVAWVCAAILVAAGLVAPAWAAHVDAVSVSANSTRTRAVIRLSGAVDYKLFQLSKPNRVVLDFSDSSLAAGFRRPQGHGLLADVRTGRHGKGGLRVVLDLTGPARPQSFLLKPGKGHGYQLVVDLYNPGVKPLSQRQATLHAAQLLGGARKVIVCVDAGHGGKDPGATGPGGVHEKTITLDVARDLAKLIDAQPGMHAVMTRKGDYYVPLRKRYEIARKANADLFISIHADAYTSSDAKGSSVWVLSRHGKVSEAARWLADTQNASDLIGGVSLDNKSKMVATTLLDLQQGYTIHASSEVANDVLDALAKIGPTHRDHIERANFVVLRSPDVPSILVETAFITNPVGERKLVRPSYQQKLAHAVLSGVKQYFEHTPPAGTWFARQAERRRGELAQASSYRVTPGDTLSGIAQHYGVTVAALKNANGMDGNLLRAGAVLTIPAGS